MVKLFQLLFIHSKFMLNFFGKSHREEAEGWSPPDERTVIDNVACILPPNLKQDMVHYFLLRFQLEEDKHYLQNLTEETKYVKYYDSESSELTDTKIRIPPDVRIRYKLVQERAKIIESIQQVYPPFIFIDDYFMPSLEYCQEVKEIYLNTNDQISIIIGNDGENIKKIEQQFNVNITLSDVPPSLKNTPNSIYRDSLCRLLIKGNSKDNISECFQHIQNIMKSKDSYDFLLSQKQKIPSENSELIAAAPWEINNDNIEVHHEEEENDEKNLYDLNSLLKNKESQYMPFINNQGPPGS